MPSAAPTDRANDSPDARAAAWCRGIHAGDPNALSDFYKSWFDRSLAIVRARTGRDESFALDVVQDAMIRVARSVPPLDSEAALSRWVTRVLTTCALDRVKAESREQSRRAHAAPASAVTASGKPDDDSHASVDETIQALQRHLAELKPDQRAALMLRFWLGRSLAAIGRAFSISEDSAHAKLRTSLRSLRRAALGDESP